MYFRRQVRRNQLALEEGHLDHGRVGRPVRRLDGLVHNQGVAHVLDKRCLGDAAQADDSGKEGAEFLWRDSCPCATRWSPRHLCGRSDRSRAEQVLRHGGGGF